MRIELVTEERIDEALDAAIRRLQTRAFPATERFRLSRHYTHVARPGDVRVLGWQGTDLAAQVAVFWARGQDARGAVKVGGIGNVCSDPDFRGAGAASACMEQAMELARRDGADWALLFCGASREGYYQRFGFRTIDNDIRLCRPDGTPYLRDRHDLRMLAPLNCARAPEGELTLDVEDF